MGKTIYLQGGLGNQLFQAVLYAHVKSSVEELKISPTLLCIPQKGVTKRNFESKFLFNKKEIASLRPLPSLFVNQVLNNKNVYIEKDLFLFDESKFNKIIKSKHIVGYFQSKYLVDKNYNKLRKKLLQKVNLKKPEKDIVIHIRGKDYLTKKNLTFHSLTTLDYYERAINKILNSDTQITNINVVTDDYYYAKKIFEKSQFNKYIKVQTETKIWNNFSYLINHKYIVVTNSSFSWWAAYIARFEHNSKIFLPAQWTAKIKTNEIDLSDIGEVSL